MGSNPGVNAKRFNLLLDSIALRTVPFTVLTLEI